MAPLPATALLCLTLLPVQEFELPVLLDFGDREPRLQMTLKGHILPANLGFLICEVEVITPT